MSGGREKADQHSAAGWKSTPRRGAAAAWSYVHDRRSPVRDKCHVLSSSPVKQQVRTGWHRHSTPCWSWGFSSGTPRLGTSCRSTSQDLPSVQGRVTPVLTCVHTPPIHTPRTRTHGAQPRLILLALSSTCPLSPVPMGSVTRDCISLTGEYM